MALWMVSRDTVFSGLLDLTSPRPFDLSADSRWWYFAAYTNQASTTFTARPDFLSWEVANPVREPATLGMFMLGLGLAAASLRRRYRRRN